MRRARKLTPYEFVILMTVGQLSLKHPSLAAMVEAIEGKLSREALHQRFTPEAAAFLWACLQEAFQQKFRRPRHLHADGLNPFRRVLLLDSCGWDVDPKLAAVLPGSGGSASAANCKVQVGYECKQGQVEFIHLGPGGKPDQVYK